jgi:hypothetical protein
MKVVPYLISFTTIFYLKFFEFENFIFSIGSVQTVSIYYKKTYTVFSWARPIFLLPRPATHATPFPYFSSDRPPPLSCPRPCQHWTTTSLAERTSTPLLSSSTWTHRWSPPPFALRPAHSIRSSTLSYPYLSCASPSRRSKSLPPSQPPEAYVSCWLGLPLQGVHRFESSRLSDMNNHLFVTAIK